MYTRRNLSVLDIYKLVLGSFLFLAPWLFAFAYAPARVDAAVSGLLVAGLSVLALVALTDWEEWAALALGLWVLFSPWVLRFPHAAGMKIHVFIGLLVIYLAGLELLLIHYDVKNESPRR
jgi:hypothetical protein